MRLDLGRTWADARQMASANHDVLSAVAGMFLLLPAILSAWWLPDRVPPVPGMKFDAVLDANVNYLLANWPIFVANALVIAFGSLALLALLLHRGRPTVATALRLALTALPVYMIASLLQSMIVATGLMLLILPGLYLGARLVCISAVAVVEERRNPIEMLARSFAITRGNGWRILVLLAIILLVLFVISTAVGTLIGIAAALLLPPDIARLMLIVVQALFETAVAVSILIVSASVYRQAMA